MVYDVQNVSRKRIIGESACESFQEVIDSWEYEVMQFTGLYDKHHKPIYEGDIVSYFGLKYEVLFKNGAFGWMEDGAFYSFNEMDRSEVNKFEIIGNIYENPELLEESK